MFGENTFQVLSSLLSFLLSIFYSQIVENRFYILYARGNECSFRRDSLTIRPILCTFKEQVVSGLIANTDNFDYDCQTARKRSLGDVHRLECAPELRKYWLFVAY